MTGIKNPFNIEPGMKVFKYMPNDDAVNMTQDTNTEQVEPTDSEAKDDSDYVQPEQKFTNQILPFNIPDTIFYQDKDGCLSALQYNIANASAEFPDMPKNTSASVSKTREFKYADYGTVVKAIRPVLSRYGISFLQLLRKDSCTIVVSGHGATITSTLGFSPSSDSRTYGANSTYARRYQLKGFFGIEGDEDADQDSFQAYRSSFKQSDFQKEQSEQQDDKTAKEKAQKDESQQEETNVQESEAVPVEEGPTKEELALHLPVNQRLSIGMKAVPEISNMQKFSAFFKSVGLIPENHSGGSFSDSQKEEFWKWLYINKDVRPF